MRSKHYHQFIPFFADSLFLRPRGNKSPFNLLTNQKSVHVYYPTKTLSVHFTSKFFRTQLRSPYFEASRLVRFQCVNISSILALGISGGITYWWILGFYAQHGTVVAWWRHADTFKPALPLLFASNCSTFLGDFPRWTTACWREPLSQNSANLEKTKGDWRLQSSCVESQSQHSLFLLTRRKDRIVSLPLWSFTHLHAPSPQLFLF